MEIYFLYSHSNTSTFFAQCYFFFSLFFAPFVLALSPVSFFLLVSMQHSLLQHNIRVSGQREKDRKKQSLCPKKYTNASPINRSRVISFFLRHLSPFTVRHTNIPSHVRIHFVRVSLCLFSVRERQTSTDTDVRDNEKACSHVTRRAKNNKLQVNMTISL